MATIQESNMKKFKELQYNIRLTEAEEKPKSQTDRDIERVDGQMKDLRDKNKDDKSSARSIDLIKLGDKKDKLNINKAKEKASENESMSMKSFSQYVAEAKQAMNIYPDQGNRNHVYGDLQIGYIYLKNKSGIGRYLLRASKQDIKIYGKGACRITNQRTKPDGYESSIIKIDPYKGKIIWLTQEVYSGDTDDIKWERPKKFYELIMQGDEFDFGGFEKWIKVLGY